MSNEKTIREQINEEKVILNAKVKNPNNKSVIKLNEAHASMDIAKNLIQDYTFILTMSVVKSIMRTLKEPQKHIKNLTDIWETRMSAQLAEETKNYEDAIHKAFDEQGEITEETSNKIKEYMDAFCKIRDNAVNMAKSGVGAINAMIFSDNAVNNKETTTKTEKKENE